MKQINTMRINAIIFLVLLYSYNAFGQHTEFGISLNSGLFSFQGPSAKKVTFLNVSQSPETTVYYTNNPYGSKNALLYGLSINVQLITKKNIIFGTDFGYENLRSKILIDKVFYSDDVNDKIITVSGETIFSHSFINLNPYVGYRIILNKYSLDFNTGFDLGYCFLAHEKSSIETKNGIKDSNSKDRSTIRFDFRPRIQATFNYKKYGLYAAYSNGLVNYQSGYVGGINECYSRIIRFGLNYKF
ncbi:MAG TPA: hypothetical protein PLD02_07185 [Saprospiraceae bacterium]|nr:hypothetical protein [Saprospiraceae bacterium]